jgi:hypothetical protein
MMKTIIAKHIDKTYVELLHNVKRLGQVELDFEGIW